MPPTVYAPKGKVEPFLDHAITRHYLSAAGVPDQGGKIIAEYVWIGGSGADLRSKSRTLAKIPTKPEDLPTWNYDGSSTGQAPGEDSEVYLVPRSIFKDPFRGGDNILVLCDAYEPPRVNPDGTVTDIVPIPTNTRAAAAAVMEKAAAEEPWFGIEQEYTLLNALTKWPLGWPDNGYPAPQGPYYCSAGAGCAIGRDIADVHYKMCLFAGVNISGVNAEVMPAQWEYQVGPCVGIDGGDHMWISRYIMYRVAEIFNVDVSFDPKPIPGDWNGAGGHCNYSNNATRAAGTGWDAIQEQIAKLEKRHAVHIASYGEGNERRLTGKHETSSMESFSWGVANRGCSIRVGRMVPVEKSGYYEDRRPASNLDPYVVTKLLVETTLLL
ncbi:glutamine synthetase [Monoraphidium neglectum]|uniref:Glutamine synthetase n=1 Tax=Monoraphidium neglectum TaxID=145388 RepID=A0A0D2K0T8_9CHLO|nr:glutamine synthetase [Monoraphidium neglectum]KIZ04228.1 glutamine synthetase [Monoraphidium neglectum]|eukprot:XP_013903247.1 glutamine synthetase [Monoraphidium neglectum]